MTALHAPALANGLQGRIPAAPECRNPYASPFAVDKPTRNPVYDPGPMLTPIASRSAAATFASSRHSWTIHRQPLRMDVAIIRAPNSREYHPITEPGLAEQLASSRLNQQDQSH